MFVNSPGIWLRSKAVFSLNGESRMSFSAWKPFPDDRLHLGLLSHSELVVAVGQSFPVQKRRPKEMGFLYTERFSALFLVVVEMAITNISYQLFLL